MRDRPGRAPQGAEVIYGRRPVLEALRAGRRRVYTLQIAEGARQGKGLEEVLREAEKQGIATERVPWRRLDEIEGRHGGVVALTDPYPWVDLEEIVGLLPPSQGGGLVLVLDVVQDPQNLGGLLRTAEAVGCEGVVLPLRRGAEITPAVVSASAGASEHLRVARSNLARALDRLKAAGLWILGLDGGEENPPLRTADLGLPLAVVVGGEAEGMRRLVREKCDWVVRLPALGAVESLNAAVAGSIALYAAWEARHPSDVRPPQNVIDGVRRR